MVMNHLKYVETSLARMWCCVTGQTQHHITDDRNLQERSCENFKSHMIQT